MRYTFVQNVKPVAVAQKSRALHHSALEEADGVAGQFLDLEAALLAVAAGKIAAVALADDFDLLSAAAEIDAQCERKGRCQRSATAPWWRVRIGHVEQQRRLRRLLCAATRRQQFVAMSSDERRRRLALGKAGMAQAGDQKILVGGDSEG